MAAKRKRVSAADKMRELRRSKEQTRTRQREESMRAFVEAAPGATKRKVRRKKAKKVRRKRSAQLNVRIDDDLMATLRDLSDNRADTMEQPSSIRDIVEMALVKYLEPPSRRLKGKARTAKALRDLANELLRQ